MLQLLLACLAVSGAAPGAEPDPVALFKAADTAMRSSESLSCTISVTGTGSLGARVPNVSGVVRAVRAPSAWAFSVKGSIAPPGSTQAQEFAAASDGATLRVLHPGDKYVEEAPLAKSGEVLDDGSRLAASWLMNWDAWIVAPFEDEENPALTRAEGTALVAGVPCNVVYVDYSRTSDLAEMDAWWYLGTDDSLPRRIDLHYYSNEHGDGFQTITLTDVARGESIDPATLAMATPDGFELRKHQPPPDSRPKPRQGLAVGDPAPDFTLSDPQGMAHTLSSYHGRVVVLDFWATWCGPCKAAMPGIQKVHERFRKQDVAVFGVNCWDQGDAVAYMASKQFTYGLLLKGDEVAQTYGVTGIPTFYVIGTDGKIVYHAVGAGPDAEEKLAAAVDNALRNKGR